MSAEIAYRRRDGNASEAIAAILHPNVGYREQLRQRGIKPKDYERANRLQLKKLQAAKREQQRQEEAAKREAFKLTRFKSVQPRVFQRPSAVVLDDENMATRPKHSFLKKGSKTAATKSRQSTSQETSDGPSVAVNSVRTTAGSTERTSKTRKVYVKPPLPSREELDELNDHLAKLHNKEAIDFVNTNAWEVIKKIPPSTHDREDNQSSRHPSFGRIPMYLLNRKEKWAREEEERRRNAPDPDCPPGMVPLPEDERVQTLAVLTKSLEEARLQMNNLPLRIETPSQIRRKTELEARLQEIEDAIKVFSKPKVYVTKPPNATTSETSPSPKATSSRRSSHGNVQAA